MHAKLLSTRSTLRCEDRLSVPSLVNLRASPLFL
jgi:hypothetical protein